MKIPFKTSALAIVASVLAAALAPPREIAPSAWASESLVVPDGPRAGETLDLDLTPYLREPLDFWSDACPDNKAAIRKSKQTGFTTLALAAIGYTIDVEPADAMLVEPTDSFLSDFVSEKLQRAIDRSPALLAKVAPQTARSGKGSTTYVKKFGAHSLIMGIATSTADLRGKTRRKVIRDEASEYPADLGGQGSPHDMITGAYETFLAGADYKDLWISTPVIKGACAIDAEFEKGDQRYWHVRCPHCDDGEFVFKFDRKNFIFNDAYPYEAHYIAPCCGGIIHAHERNALVRGGRWIATAPGPGKFRSYHFDTLSSPFVPWDEIAKRYLEAQNDPAKQKTFDNLTLGVAHEVRGDAPDVERLMERREDYEAGRVPAKGLLLVAGADVQHSGIWVEIVAFAPDGASWSVLHRFLEGDTTDPDAGAFLQLAAVYDGKLPDAFDGQREIDAMAVDAGDGGRANQVYTWTRTRHRAYATKGVAGWGAPAVGTPTQVDVNFRGKKVRRGAMLWPIGTWSLKATHYANLGKAGILSGAPIDPPGYCHFSKSCDERYFRQLTAEFLKTVTVRGRSVRIWQETGPNHLLDCRVMAMAMAEYLGLSRMNEEQWKELARMRGVPQLLAEPDLMAPDSVKLAAASPAAAESSLAAAAAATEAAKADEAYEPEPASDPYL